MANQEQLPVVLIMMGALRFETSEYKFATT